MKSIRLFMAILFSIALAACGSSSGGGSTPATYGISGTVTVSGAALAGATITLTGGTTATTDASGNYSFTGLANGSYTVTPTKAGSAFSPVSLAVSVSGANVTGINFAATTASATYSISGAVSGATGVTLTLTLSGDNTGSVVAGTGGVYTLSGLVPGSYTVTPSLSGFTFSPTSTLVTLATVNSAANNFVATTAIPTVYTQADLTGTWRINMLRTGSTDGWLRSTGTLDSSGLMTASSFLDSTGNSTPPAAGSIQWTINGSGVISETGINAGSLIHMTMTSNKNFIAGTGSDGNSQLRIIQKVVPGTVYSNADVQNKTFVFHQLSVGSQYKWFYGTGTVDGTGQINISSQTDPSGTTAPGAQGTISVDSSGVVTMSSGMASYSGFLSDDKKTIVGTYTDDAGGGNLRYRLMVIQIAGQTYTAGTLPAGASFAHMLTGGSAPAPFWVHDTVTIASGGVMTFSDWVSNNSAVTGPTTTYTGSISALGTVSIVGNSSYHGQVSHDGKFTVGTQTINSGAYSLQVNTK